MRRLVAALSLVVLAVSLARSLEPGPLVLRAHRLALALAGRPVAPAGSEGFWFDADYAAFLSDIRARTPETATVAVIVPRKPDLYVYQANYQLAPRRVVEERWKDEASYIATYRTEAARGPLDGARPITGGTLWAR